jgi:hypothetical protein
MLPFGKGPLRWRPREPCQHPGVEPPKEITPMPMMFWLPAILISEMWSMAWSEMPALIPRPIRLPKK